MKTSNIIKLIATVLLLGLAFFLFGFEPPINPTWFQDHHTLFAGISAALGVILAATTFKPGKKV